MLGLVWARRYKIRLKRVAGWLLRDLGCGGLMVMMVVRRRRDVVGWVEVGVHDLV